MCLSAQLNINSTANPSSVYLAVLSQPYATHQTERGDTEGMVSNPTPQGANRSEKQRWIPPSFLSPWRVLYVQTLRKTGAREQSNKRETFEKKKKKKMKRWLWLRDVQMKEWREKSQDGNISVYRSGWMGSIWEDARRTITESLPLARSVVIRSLGFICQGSELTPKGLLSPLEHVGARRIMLPNYISLFWLPCIILTHLFRQFYDDNEKLSKLYQAIFKKFLCYCFLFIDHRSYQWLSITLRQYNQRESLLAWRNISILLVRLQSKWNKSSPDHVRETCTQTWVWMGMVSGIQGVLWAHFN